MFFFKPKPKKSPIDQQLVKLSEDRRTLLDEMSLRQKSLIDALEFLRGEKEKASEH